MIVTSTACLRGSNVNGTDGRSTVHDKYQSS